MAPDVRFELLWPEFLVAGLAFVIFTLDFFLRPERKNILAWVSVIGLSGILAFTIPYLLDENDSLFNGSIVSTTTHCSSRCYRWRSAA